MAESQFEKVSFYVRSKIALWDTYFVQVRALFDLYDSDADNSLSLNELCLLLQEIGNKITALPAVGVQCCKHHFTAG